ncbi:hypothetical protein ACFL6U_21010 [Planctomycetota bacterium]
MAKTRTILGLAFEDAQLRIAEVRVGTGQPRLLHSAVFPWPTENALDQSVQSAESLRAFLKQNHMTAKSVVVGLPAKWLITKELSLPPANTETLQGILRLQAERAFSLDPQELALDYIGPIKNGQTAGVLLVGTQRQRLDKILALLKNTGLEVLAVTSTSLCLRRLDQEGHQGLYVVDDGIETWPVRSPLPQLRFTESHERVVLDGEELQSQIRRLLLLSESSPDQGPQGISLYANTALDDDTFTALCRSMNGHAVLLNGDAWLEQAGFTHRSLQEAGPARVAAALSLAPSRQAGLEVDFLHSAMTQKIKKSHSRAVTWGVIGAAVLLVLVAMAWMDAHQNLSDIARDEARLAAMADDIADAKAVAERVTYATRWTSREPEFLLHLKQLTETFPEQGSVWVTNVAIAENKKAIITGQATDERPVLQVLDTLKAGAHFDQVKLLFLRDAGRNTNEVSFAVGFRFKETK